MVCPLNWGLGHATRCIPIIDSLLKQKAEVIIASDGVALSYLKEEYPNLQSTELPSYNVKYKKDNMVWNMASQLPAILSAMKKEKNLIQKYKKDFKLDGIISDNRYGCYDKTIPSIFITHQVNIKTPFWPIEKTVNFFNHKFIKNFDSCWVPDNEKKPRLAGELSVWKKSNSLEFIGPLSRMQFSKQEKKYDVIVVLSGPEPQRAKLEEILIKQLLPLNLSVLLVKGTMQSGEQEWLRPKFQVIPYLTSTALNQAILSADLVVSRSGYSSIMDYAKLACKAILIPTPGQTEQEYLAEYFKKEKIFYSQNQEEINMIEALQKSDLYRGLGEGYFNENVLDEKVGEFLQKV